MRARRLTAEDQIRIVQQLETLLGADRVDLIILPEAGAFLAANVVGGELLLATDLNAEAEVQLYYLRRALEALLDLGRHILANGLGERRSSKRRHPAVAGCDAGLAAPAPRAGRR